jgi:hypothetical protein
MSEVHNNVHKNIPLLHVSGPIGPSSGRTSDVIAQNNYIMIRGKINPITGLDRPLRFQEVEAPRSLDNRHMKVVRLSALCTGRLYPQAILQAESTPRP